MARSLTLAIQPVNCLLASKSDRITGWLETVLLQECLLLTWVAGVNDLRGAEHVVLSHYGHCVYQRLQQLSTKCHWKILSGITRLFRTRAVSRWAAPRPRACSAARRRSYTTFPSGCWAKGLLGKPPYTAAQRWASTLNLLHLLSFVLFHHCFLLH